MKSGLRHALRGPSRLSVYIDPRGSRGARGMRVGSLLGGSWNGEQHRANKVRGIRCAVCFSWIPARWARLQTTQMPWPSARTPYRGTAMEMVPAAGLETKFEGGRTSRASHGISAVENSAASGAPGGFPVHERRLSRPEVPNPAPHALSAVNDAVADELASAPRSLTFPQACFVTRRVRGLDFTGTGAQWGTS